MTVRVKVCGITNEEDALVAARAGADALGFVFYQPSPRNVSANDVARICATLPPFVTSVGLFVNPEQEFVDQVLRQVPLDLLQFHGDESEADCSRFGVPYIKAIRMKEAVDLRQQCRIFHSSRGILLDTFVAGVAGGTGRTFDWTAVPHSLEKPIILAGGLNPDNVATSINQVKPWAVDVSGGVERSKGLKDSALVNAFIKGVNSVSI